MGLAALSGEITDSYPALDVKAGIILEACVCKRARASGRAGWPEYTGVLHVLTDNRA